jgi:gluconolactonase
MSIVARDPSLSELVSSEAKVEKLADGFLFTEGPVWDEDGDRLIFSDIPGDTMYAWSEHGVEVFRRPSNKSNGLALDGNGRLLACEHATSRVVRTDAAGDTEVLASHYRGRELNSPNDVVVRTDGLVFFTDPPFGRQEFFGVPRERELDFQGVYCVRPGDLEPSLLADDFQAPNGLCLSLDERRLYINDSPRMEIRVFDVGPDGELSKGRLFLRMEGDPETGVPDGMKLDERGNVYCTGPRGVWVIDPESNVLGVIEVPEIVGNFAWGGRAFDELFIAASKSLYRIPMRVRGARSQNARAGGATASAA